MRAGCQAVRLPFEQTRSLLPRLPEQRPLVGWTSRRYKRNAVGSILMILKHAKVQLTTRPGLLCLAIWFAAITHSPRFASANDTTAALGTTILIGS
jgi:hypothetical protein